MLEYLLSISVDLIHTLQTQAEWLTPIMKFFTFLGNEEFFLLVMPVFLWAVDYNSGVRLGIIMLLSGSINTIAKFSFHQPRPYWISGSVKNLSHPMVSFGLPSGHSQNAASGFGLMATMTKRKWLSWVLVFVILMVAFSRLFLGVHSLADIFLGLLLGAILLWLFLKFEEKVKIYFAGLPVISRVILAFFVAVGLIFVAIGISLLLKDFTLPQNWVDNAYLTHPEEELNPFSINGVITTSAAFFGVVLGSIWINETGGFKAQAGTWWQRILRFALGLVGVLILWMGLGAVFPRNNDLISYALRFLRYTLIGFWASGLAPFLFIQLKIGQREH